MIYAGDALTVLRTLPAGTVQTCICSPPYWGLRDYGTATWAGGAQGCDHLGEPFRTSANMNANWDGGNDTKTRTNRQPFKDVCGKCGARRIDAQLGLERTPEEYVAALVAVFREVRRVLRDDGTLWINLGDSYASGATGRNDTDRETPGGRGGSFRGGPRVALEIDSGLKLKDLVGIPWLVAFALRADGWYLRSDIIWAKPNPMPESVTDRPTKAHEYLFLLAKNERYFYDSDAIREPHQDKHGTDRFVNGCGVGERRLNQGWSGGDVHLDKHRDYNPAGRNRRSVWTVATQPYPEAHFATFPPDLIKPCVLAGTSERGGCSVCGAPWERVVERIPAEVKAPASDYGHGAGRNDGGRSQLVGAGATTLGWRPTCAHDAPTVPQTVLDPFAGAGTTCFVAKELGRRWIGIELNPAYITLADDRMRQEVLPFMTSMTVANP